MKPYFGMKRITQYDECMAAVKAKVNELKNREI